MVNLIKNKTIYLNYDKCYKYEVRNLIINKTIEETLTTNHLKADTKIVLHLCQVNTFTVPSNILVKANDTDVIIILLGNMMNLLQKENIIWMNVGNTSMESETQVDILMSLKCILL